MEKAYQVEIFTDGACRGNPGPGGWGALLRYQHREQEIYGAERNTTNNRMELLAAIRGLERLKKPCQVMITTDSQYVQRGVTQWLQKWKAQDWKGSNKKPIKNRELWEELDRLSQRHAIQWHWVRGHSGHVENERADQLANKAIDELLE